MTFIYYKPLISVTLPNQQNEYHINVTNLCLLLFYVLATSKIISWWVPTCDSAHSWQLYSAASLGHQAASTITWYHTQSYYPDTESTSRCTILIMPSTMLGSDKYQFKRLLTRTRNLWIIRSPRLGGRHSTHSAIPTGSGNPNLMGSNPVQVKPITLILILVAP